MSWDLNRHLRGKVAVALFAATVACTSGAQALAPSLASALLTDNCDPICSDGGVGAPAGVPATDAGVPMDAGGTTDAGTTGSSSATDAGTAGSSSATSTTGDSGISDFLLSPFSSGSKVWKTEPETLAGLSFSHVGTTKGHPNLRSLDPDYILTKAKDKKLRGMFVDAIAYATIDEMSMDILVGDCNSLSNRIDELNRSVSEVDRDLDSLPKDQPNAKVRSLRERLDNLLDRRRTRQAESDILFCSIVESQGRD
jgi:hypothetical protein